MPNRDELAYGAAKRDDVSTDAAVRTMAPLCAAGWAVSVCVAIFAQPADYLALLIAQAALG